MNADAWGQLVRVVEILIVPFVLWVCLLYTSDAADDAPRV